MANPHKGEVEFEAEGKAYKLRFSANAICEMEDALDQGIVSIGQEMASWERDVRRIRMKTVRAVFWAGLRDAHPEITLVEAGNLMVAAGGITPVSMLLGKAFSAAFPEPKTKGARPPKAGQTRNGIGPAS